MTSNNLPYKTFTFTFDPINKVELDVYVPLPNENLNISELEAESLPAVISFHGGGIISGSKKDLYFPTYLLDILEDVETLFKYLSSDSTELSSTLKKLGYKLDSTKLGVIGISGGDYPARASFILPSIPKDIKPKAYLNLYGMAGDFLLDHWIKIKEEGNNLPRFPYDIEKVKLILSSKLNQISDSPINPTGDSSGRVDLLSHFYHQGTLLDYLLDQVGLSRQLENLSYKDRFSNIPKEKQYLLLPFNEDIDYPKSIIFVHGKVDTVVPAQASYNAQEQLKSLGIESKAFWVEGANHGLVDDSNFPNSVPGTEAIFDEAVRDILNALQPM
uniref:Peptidase S9 prolyl oligopeptidase catalytic domain-containing protein n=1 Tax=Kwoniella pini CBS 10737 TaxID=1296096 RepID=A0A1B9HXB0_9TREE|nr:uncharacterized protein I206_05751 [Kwoniella pini CBS 10737]OCF47888.1 hypothetical protein I206_05751 [Kwoniella pini CBS 10737]